MPQINSFAHRFHIQYSPAIFGAVVGREPISHNSSGHPTSESSGTAFTPIYSDFGYNAEFISNVSPINCCFLFVDCIRWANMHTEIIISYLDECCVCVCVNPSGSLRTLQEIPPYKWMHAWKVSCRYLFLFQFFFFCTRIHGYIPVFYSTFHSESILVFRLPCQTTNFINFKQSYTITRDDFLWVYDFVDLCLRFWYLMVANGIVVVDVVLSCATNSKHIGMWICALHFNRT